MEGELWHNSINKQKGLIALNRQGRQQQKLESPTVTPSGQVELPQASQVSVVVSLVC